MNPLKLVIVIVSIALITIGATLIVKTESQKLAEWSMPYNYSVEAVKIVGISVDTTLPIQFGTSSPGSTLMRFIDVGNNQNFPIKVVIKEQKGSDGQISFKDPGLIPPGENVRVGTYIKIPKDAKPGDYKGTLQITTFKP